MSIRIKMFAVVVAVIALVGLVSIGVSVRAMLSSLDQQAQTARSNALQDVVRALSITDQIMAARVQSSMKQLIEDGLRIGQPRLGEESVTVGERMVPQLYLGDAPQALNYDLVDHLTEKMGGTATLFVKADDGNYVRVSTNVKRGDARATGTILTPGGAVFQKIENGESFFGQIDILNSPYLTGYVPMLNSASEVIGIWYVGYSADLSFIEDIISNLRVLEQGFVALQDDKGRVRMISSTFEEGLERAQEIIESGSSDNWDIATAEFQPWGYKVFALLSKDEVTSNALFESIKVAAFIFLATLVILISLGIAIRFIIEQPLKRLMAVVENLASGEGDLTVRFNSARKDEFGTLANGFDAVLEKIQQTMKTVNGLGNDLGDISSRLSSMASSTLASSERQGSELATASSAIHELSATATTVAKSALDAEHATLEGVREAENGDQQLSATVTAIREQMDAVSRCQLSVDELRAQSDSIGTVLDMINSIAEQTNLLALNAAIEAARAGEHGRGFSVVAEEVRNLSHRTQDAVEEIRTRIDGLQSSSSRMSDNISLASERSETLNQLTTKCQDAMASIRSAMATIGDQNTAIASAAEEQSQVSHQISETLEHIAHAARTNTDSAQDTSSQSQRVAEMTERLKAEMNRYRTD